MAKKKEEINRPIASTLKMPKQKVVDLLRKQIEQSDVLLKYQVPSHQVIRGYDMFGGGGHAAKEYDKEAQNSFFNEFHKWDARNEEIFTRAFVDANNTNLDGYRQTGRSYFISDVVEDQKKIITKLVAYLQGFIDRIDLIPCEIEEKPEEPASLSSKDTTSVFIVHGHDDLAINEVKVFLMKIGFNPIVLREKPNESQTIIEKIEKYTNVGFAIVLYTPCDEGKAKESSVYKSRARQNVVFEHGYLCAKLGRKYVCAQVKDDVEIPGDLGGVVYTHMNPGWEMLVARELKSAGYTFDASKLL